MDLIEIIKNEWSVISGAPFALVSLVVIIWIVIHRIYKERFKSVNELLALRNQKIEAIVDGTGSTSIEEALSRITVLETELKELGETDLVAIFNEADDYSNLPSA